MVNCNAQGRMETFGSLIFVMFLMVIKDIGIYLKRLTMHINY